MKHWHGNYRTGLPVERIVDRISADWQQVLVSRDQSCDLMLMAPPTPLCIQTHFQDTRLMQCSRIRIVYVFSELKKHDFLRFFWNDVSKSRKKSQKVWSLPNVYRKFGIKTARCYGYGLLYRRLSHTFFSVAYVVCCVHTSEQDVWCWWPWFTGTDLQQLSAKWLSGLWNYTYVFYFFYVFTFFFKIQKTWLCTCIELLPTFSQTLDSCTYTRGTRPRKRRHKSTPCSIFQRQFLIRVSCIPGSGTGVVWYLIPVIIIEHRFLPSQKVTHTWLKKMTYDWSMIIAYVLMCFLVILSLQITNSSST